jgi:hypothetical protein
MAAACIGTDLPPFEITVVGVRAHVRSGRGMHVPVCATSDAPAPEWVVVPAISAKTMPFACRSSLAVANASMPEVLLTALERDDVADATAALRAWADGGAALPDKPQREIDVAQRRAGGHHRAAGHDDAMGIEPHIGIALPEERGQPPGGGRFMPIEQVAFGQYEELAALVARYLIFDTRPPQSAYVISDHLAHADPLVERFDRWVRERLDTAITLDAVADALATSKRTLSRRLDDVLGKTPFSHIQDLHIERAAESHRGHAASFDYLFGMPFDCPMCSQSGH